MIQVWSFLKDYMSIIHKELLSDNEGMTLEQIKKCKKVLGDFIQAKQLKQASICWISNSTLPLDPDVYA